MTWRSMFRSLRRVKPKADGQNMVSIVLLLREPEILLEWEYSDAIGKSWGGSERNNVVVHGPLALLRIDANLVHDVSWQPPVLDIRGSASGVGPSPGLFDGGPHEPCVRAGCPICLMRNDASRTERLGAVASSCETGR